jgi:sulfatase modifying factor 1
MADKSSQRHVFISYVAKDPDWPVRTIRSLVSDVSRAGIRVEVDLWERSPNARFEPIGAWRKWMDEIVIGADHVLCLVSPRYLQMWKRRFEDSRDGLALQAISVISDANSHAKDGWRRLITISPSDQGNDAIPAELAPFLNIEWDTERSRLISFLSKNDHESAGPGSSPPGIGGVALSSFHSDSSESEEEMLVPDLSSSSVMDAWREEAKSRGVGGGVPTVLLTEVVRASDEVEVEVRSSSIATVSRSKNGFWLAEDVWRAPLGDFPPPWASAWGDDVYGLWADLTVNGVTQRMRWIEPSGPEGFWMGAPQAERDAIQDKIAREWANQNEHDPRRESIKNGFWLADTPCTQAFWSAVLGDNPSYFSDRANALLRPVESVSWDEIVTRFIARFIQTPEWGTEGRLCLPTEVEWEYAARAGTITAYWWGDQPDDRHANYGKLREGSSPVKDYMPNPWGLFDMHGNVWEWCADSWQPHGRAPKKVLVEELRVVRGGSWIYSPGLARAAYRDGRPSWFTTQTRGFRFALRSPRWTEA